MVQDVNQNEDVDGDIEMEDEEVPKAKPRQRKPRKAVPVGRNGLKKKRVIRSRTTADEKGYMGIVVIIVGKRHIDCLQSQRTIRRTNRWKRERQK